MNYSAHGHRLNKRGRETRQVVLATAFRCLAAGGPEAVSANLIAKEAGVTWGTIQHQFGDSDGVWAAVFDATLDTFYEHHVPKVPASASVRRRLSVIVDLLWVGSDSETTAALHTLRMALPQDPALLAKEFPATAAALERSSEAWVSLLDDLFDGLVTSKTKLRRARSLLSPALFGIRLVSKMGTSDEEIEDAKRCLVDSLVAYLES